MTSKMCSQSILWQINNLVQCHKMKSKSTVRNASKTFQAKNNQALSIHLYLASQGLQLNDQKKLLKTKVTKTHIIINSTKLPGA